MPTTWCLAKGAWKWFCRLWAHAEGVTARLAALRTKFDAGEEVFLVRSDTFGEINGVDNTVVFTCNNTCSYLDRNGNTVDIEADGILTTLAAYEVPLPVLTRSDLTTSFYGGDNKVYGAWMEHGAFFVDVSPGTTARTERYAVALEASTGEAPAVVGTWTGLMVGTPQRGNNKGDILQGDATLKYTPDYHSVRSIRGTFGSLNVSFTGIKNIDTPSYVVPDISIENVHVTSSGEYSVDERPDIERRFIEGDFMGTDHAETAGVFEHSGIVGAFGARKQPDSD